MRRPLLLYADQNLDPALVLSFHGDQPLLGTGVHFVHIDELAVHVV